MSQKLFWTKEYKKKIPDLTDSKKISHAVYFLLDFLKREKKLYHRGKILEVGCGKGRNLFFLAEKGFDVWGVDFSEEALRIARKTVRSKRNSNVHFKFADISKRLPFTKNLFDIVLDILASGTLNEKERLMLKKEVNRVLIPGGYFLIYAPNRKFIEKSFYLKPVIGGGDGLFIDPKLKIIERSYYLDELQKIFPNLELVRSEIIEYMGKISDRYCLLSYVCGIFRKPSHTDLGSN